MNAALAALNHGRSRTSTPALASANVTPNADLDPLRLRLVQLIDAVTLLHSQLEYLAYHPAPPSTANPGLPPFPDLVSRYNLLLTNLAAVQGLVSSEQDRDREIERERREGAQGGPEARRKRAERDRDPKREKWDSLVVVPATKVDEARDWIVGTLLRTKQIPEVEAAQSAAVSTLPEPFASALEAATSSATAATTSAPAIMATNSGQRAADSDPDDSFLSLAHAQSRLLTLAHNKVLALKEFNSENEEWDWKARVELDPDEEEEEERGEADDNAGLARDTEMKGTADEGPRAWTIEEVQTFLRTGKKPVL